MPTPENPLEVSERAEEFIIPESLQQSGLKTAPANITPVNDNKGNPITQTPAQSAKIQIPGDRSTLLKKAKGSITDAATWLARFFLRLIKKQNANTTND
jgi:hypothetical protein